jgi:hypothetical protein
MSASDRQLGNDEGNELISLDRQARYVDSASYCPAILDVELTSYVSRAVSADPIIHVKFLLLF